MHCRSREPKSVTLVTRSTWWLVEQGVPKARGQKRRLVFPMIRSLLALMLAWGCGAAALAQAIAPTITSQPANKSVVVGQTAKFSVTASGTTPLSYQWAKDGAIIAGATNSSYTTPATTLADSGSLFAVTVSNSAGSVTSKNATLTVTAQPVAPSITTQPANKTVSVGLTATFSVKATGTTPLKYQWMKNGAAITGATKASYTTPAVTQADNGTLFSVMISNVAGSVTSNTATLTVSTAPPTPPSITIQPISETITEGKTASFAVKAIGTKPLLYQWRLNGADTAGATRDSYTTGITGISDSGDVFGVTVSNSLGSVTSNDVTLTVQPSPAPTPPPSPTPTPSLPPINHIFIVMEENHSYSEIIGSGAMPYLQSLADRYGLATNYYGNTHPSIGNYFMLTTGQIITNSDSYSATVPDDNIVRHLIANGKTWREYSENLPYVGYFGPETHGYDRHHNPLSYFSDVRDSTVQQQNLVPFTQLASDMAAGQLPNYGFIVPTDAHDAHSGTALAADQWLQTNIGPLISDPQFRQDGLLFIVFDESRGTDTAYGGGQIVCVMVGPSVKPGYRSDILYQHQNLLRTVCDLLGIGSFSTPSLATDAAASMAEFISPLPSPTPSATP